MYNASSSSVYKWEFIGGPPLLASGGQTDISTSWTSGATTSVGRAGGYQANASGVLLWDTGTPIGNEIDYGLSVGGATPTPTGRAAPKAGSVEIPFVLQGRLTDVAAGDAIAFQACDSSAIAGPPNWIDSSQIAVQPIRVS